MLKASIAACLFLFAACALTSPGTEQDLALADAFLEDEQCTAGDDDCALNALQLRALKTSGDPEEATEVAPDDEDLDPMLSGGANGTKPKWGSCFRFGCVEFRDWQGCQCNVDCKKYGTCCDDWSDTCGKLTHLKFKDPGTCAQYGCVAFTREHKCQCHPGCTKRGNCCSDYAAKCPAIQHLVAPPPPPVATTASGTGKVYGHPRPGATYPQYPGFTLMLVEEFDAPLDLDKDSIWTWSDGGLDEGRVRFVKEGIKFENGKMVIEMTNTLTVPIQPCSNAEVRTISQKPFTSGEIRTRHNMFRYGIYEARLKAPFVQGTDPVVNGNFVATMFVFRDSKYKHWRELDFEITGGKADSASSNVLYAENTNQWREGIGEEGVHSLGVNLRADFHDYRIQWLPNKVTWFFDGKQVREKTANSIPIPELSGKIMANLWMFKDDDVRFGGNEMWNNHYPMRSEYDWIRFYKWNGDTQYPCADFSTSCLSPDDKYLSSNNGCDGIAQVGTIYGQPAPCYATCH